MFRHGPSCLEGPVSRTLDAWTEKKTPAASSQGDERRSGESLPQPAEFRKELVAEIRRQIAQGTYETPEKWESALELLFQQLQDAESES